jgi:hypothetical protein
MRLRVVTSALVSVLLLAGCGSSGSTTGSAPSVSAAAPWLIYQSGDPSPSATPAPSLDASATGLPWTPLPSASACPIAWPTDVGQVFIPMIVTPGVGSLTVRWPSSYGPNYRVAAVNQKLVTGTQPPPNWVDVTVGAGCTTTATLTGLISGNPYVVWLDAPNTPHYLDNSRSLYSGRSNVVKPL